MHRLLYYTEKGKNMDKYLLSLLPNILLCIICKNSIAGYGDFSDRHPYSPGAGGTCIDQRSKNGSTGFS